VNCVSHTIFDNLRIWKLHTTSVIKLSLPGLTFYEIFYPTYSTLNNKRGIFCCENMFRTLFRAGLMSLIFPRVGWSVEHSDQWKWSPLEKKFEKRWCILLPFV